MPEIGRTISRYKSIERPGQGVMGVVYRAEGINPDRPIAIKVLKCLSSARGAANVFA